MTFSAEKSNFRWSWTAAGPPSRPAIPRSLRSSRTAGADDHWPARRGRRPAAAQREAWQDRPTMGRAWRRIGCHLARSGRTPVGAGLPRPRTL